MTIRPNRDRPFPWRCGNCGERDVDRKSTKHRTTIKYEGRHYEIVIPDLQLPTCKKCGEVVFDNFAGEQIDNAFRRQLGIYWDGFIIDGGDEFDAASSFFRYIRHQVESDLHVPRNPDGKSYYQRHKENWWLDVK